MAVGTCERWVGDFVYEVRDRFISGAFYRAGFSFPYKFTNPCFIQYVNIKGAKVRGMELEGLFYRDGWNVQLAMTRMLARNTIDKTNPYMGYLADLSQRKRFQSYGRLQV